jgi:bacterioferritin-associated ferredoxin
MSIRARLKRLEERAGVIDSCSECGGRIPYVVREGGETSYPFGEPCGKCEGVPVIEVILEGPEGDAELEEHENRRSMGSEAPAD